MKTISVNNASFEYAKQQICGLTLFVGHCGTIQGLADHSQSLWDREEHDNSMEEGSFKMVFARNLNFHLSSNLLHTATLYRKKHILTNGKCECAAGVQIRDVFQDSDEQILSCLCACSEERNCSNDPVELRTCHPGMPAIQGIQTMKLAVGDGMEVIDVLSMATFLSPLEFVLCLGAYLPCKEDLNLDEEGGLVKTYKEYISKDAQYVVPIEGKIFRLLEPFDCYQVRINENSRALLMTTKDVSNFTELVVQLLHLAKASFLANADDLHALMAFLNCTRWKFHLLAVFASKEKMWPSMEVQETVVLNNSGMKLSVHLAGGKVNLISEAAKDEKWFQITKVLIEHLFHEQLNWPKMAEQDRWMLPASYFSFANASCSIYDARSAVQLLDYWAALKSGCASKEAYSRNALMHHELLGDWLNLSDGEDSSDSEGNVTHNGLEEGPDIERREFRTFGMVLSKQRGWSLTCPIATSTSVTFPGFFKGKLTIQNRRFHFIRRGDRERDEPIPRPVSGPQVMSSGLKYVSEPEEESSHAVAEMALCGKAGGRAGRWVLGHMMHGSVDIGPTRPTFLKHLPIVEDGIDVTAVLGSDVIAGLEVIVREGSDSSVRIPSSGIIPEYKILMAYQGYANLEQSEYVGKEAFAASLKRGPSLI